MSTAPIDSVSSWPLRDRIGYFAAWGAGITLIVIAAAILIYMAYRGAQYFDLGLLTADVRLDVDLAFFTTVRTGHDEQSVIHEVPSS